MTDRQSNPFSSFAPPSGSPQMNPFSPNQAGVMSPSLSSAFNAPNNPQSSRSNTPSRAPAAAATQSSAGQMSNPLLNVCKVTVATASHLYIIPIPATLWAMSQVLGSPYGVIISRC